jgi:hypothetical protein
VEDLEQIESAVHEIAKTTERDVHEKLHDLLLGLVGMDRKIDAMGSDVARLLAVVEQVAAQAEQVGALFGSGTEAGAGAAPDLGAALGGGLGGNLLGSLLKRKLG